MKSRHRVKNYGEVFTPRHMVKRMLDLVREELETGHDFVDKTFLEPAAGHGNFLDNDDLPRGDAHVNPDIDGDGVLDGADDQDHDGVPNQFEIRRPLDWVAEAIVGYPDAAANPWAYVNPFNPCKPFNSERCHEHPPFGYYDSDDMPFMGPNPPPGFPGGGPATPAGP